MRLSDAIAEFILTADILGFELKALVFKEGDQVYGKILSEQNQLQMASNLAREPVLKLCGVEIREEL